MHTPSPPQPFIYALRLRVMAVTEVRTFAMDGGTIQTRSLAQATAPVYGHMQSGQPDWCSLALYLLHGQLCLIGQAVRRARRANLPRRHREMPMNLPVRGNLRLGGENLHDELGQGVWRNWTAAVGIMGVWVPRMHDVGSSLDRYSLDIADMRPPPCDSSGRGGAWAATPDGGGEWPLVRQERHVAGTIVWTRSLRGYCPTIRR